MSIDLFRSEPMVHVSICFVDSAREATLNEIGAFNGFHPIDLAIGTEHSPRQMQLRKRLQDIAGLEKRFQTLADLCTKYKVRVPNRPVDRHAMRAVSLEHITEYLDRLESELRQHETTLALVQKQLIEAEEFKVVLAATQAFNREAFAEEARYARSSSSSASSLLPRRGLGTAARRNERKSSSSEIDSFELQETYGYVSPDRDLESPLPRARSPGSPTPSPLPYVNTGSNNAPSSSLAYTSSRASVSASEDDVVVILTGMMDLEYQAAFDKVVFRRSHGKAFTRFVEAPYPLVDPTTGALTKKVVFYVVVLGKVLHRRIVNLARAFSGRIYTVPDDDRSFDMAIREISSANEERRSMIQATERVIVQLLSDLAFLRGKSPIRQYQWALLRERRLAELLQMVVSTESNSIEMQGWVPAKQALEFERRIRRAIARDPSLSQPILTFSHAPRSPHSMEPGDVDVEEDEVEPSQSTEDNNNNPGGLERRSSVDNRTLSSFLAKFPVVRHPQPPPTLLRGNKFTQAFQGIVDTYGIPRYQEANPGLFTIITFPFLFGVMFGDIGHGLLMILAGIVLVLAENSNDQKKKQKKLSEFLEFLHNGRYLILMMGIFSFYCGTIYNDCMSIMPNIFGSSYYNGTTTPINGTLEWTGDVYPWGIDPAWAHKKNELNYMNSFKMKLAVILGVVQMTFGLVLALKNHIYFGDTSAVWLEFLPRLLFLLSTFGYMVIIIIIKWCTEWPNTNLSPPLIQSMITMFLKLGDPGDIPIYPYQLWVQRGLLFTAVACVPVMLFGKPLYNAYGDSHAGYAQVNRRSDPDDEEKEGSDDDEDGHDGERGATKKKSRQLLSPQSSNRSDRSDSDSDTSLSLHLSTSSTDDVAPITLDVSSSKGSDPMGEGHDFSEEMIHSMIHTIEFVLGAVSNTASYLRLWALSLAHAQLSSVFWSKMVQENGIERSPIFLVIGGFMWMFATLGVLMGMDALECFLHALRLHWVEFQNKFYGADGYQFKPFNFEDEDDQFLYYTTSSKRKGASDNEDDDDDYSDVEVDDDDGLGDTDGEDDGLDLDLDGDDDEEAKPLSSHIPDSTDLNGTSHGPSPTSSSSSSSSSSKNITRRGSSSSPIVGGRASSPSRLRDKIGNIGSSGSGRFTLKTDDEADEVDYTNINPSSPHRGSPRLSPRLSPRV